MKLLFARIAMITALIVLAIAAPIPEGSLPGAAVPVIGEQTSMIPNGDTAASVTPLKKNVRRAEPLIQPERVAEPLVQPNRVAEPPAEENKGAEPPVKPKKTVRWANQIATPLEPRPMNDRFALSGEALSGAEQRSPAVLAENAAPRPPPRIRLKSPYPYGWGQAAPVAEVKSVSSQGRSWLPNWKLSSWVPKFSRPTGWTWANAVGRNDLQRTARYMAPNPSVAPSLFRQNASHGRAIASKPSWMQSLTEGARGFFRKAAAPLKYFHGI
ncbi:uncharacterized protein UTRI_04545_B [Ustilago trichophora]|uniref:Uncharacterized protein n=1 Tax=Ustilago trichophora TaxID=86804 RepID=A0A5C3ECK2_9BASI|nr:uncharacterized protein UTRI_04545_B [Ustilago trichophora]